MTGTVPIPWLMDAEVALVEVQVSVDDPPRLIEVGTALNVVVGFAAKIGRNALRRTSKPTEIINLFLFIDNSTQKLE